MVREIEARIGELTARGIADATTRAIREGAYEEGERLPTIRDLAAVLGVSHNTVASAWTILARAGVVRSEGRRGTIVTWRAHLGPERTRSTLAYATRFDLDLSAGLPDFALLPDLRAALGRLETIPLPHTYLDEPVIPELAERLREDWPFPAEAITVVDGAHDALDLIIALKVRYGDPVAVERITDANLLDLLEVAGARLIPVDVDGEGAVPDSLEAAIAAGARWAFLQPRAQQPRGTTWSAGRAAEIADVLRRHEGVSVVELDLCGAIATTPLVSLGAVLPSRVLHVRAYSSSHGPEIRIAALGGSGELLDDVLERRQLGQGWTSRILQALLLELLRDERVDDQVEIARETYARRRAQLIEELAERGIPAEGADGLFVRVGVPLEATTLVALAARGIGVAPGTPNAVDVRDSSHIVVTTTVLPVERAADVADAIAASAAPRRFRGR